MAGIITIFHAIEALNHCCYSRERRQKRPGPRMIAKTAIPTICKPIQDARPSDGISPRKAAIFPETQASSHDARSPERAVAVNANPLRILRAAPDFQGIRVGWRCTTIGLCSSTLYSRRFISSAADG
ncbi:hypothetical protein [Pseudomonas indica]|uniref:hypothetical protein n=1 Tax=Pseudomonas indica TaxID=137658 RepID=UPI003FD01C25